LTYNPAEIQQIVVTRATAVVLLYQFSINFYHMMLRRARYCYGKSSSVCLSVTFKYRGHIGWNTLKIISRLISLGCSLSVNPNITDLPQVDHPKIPGGIGVG